MHAVTSQALGELILFATISDNADPLTREGMPHPARQTLLCEQRVLEQCMRCVEVPYAAAAPFSYDMVKPARRKATGTEGLHAMGELSQRLARHILRRLAPNKLAAMRLDMHVKLQSMTGYGFKCVRMLQPMAPPALARRSPQAASSAAPVQRPRAAPARLLQGSSLAPG